MKRVDLRRNQSRIVSAGILAALAWYLVFLFPYATGYGERRIALIGWLRSFWFAPDSDWVHGALVPFIVIGLLIHKRREICVGPAIGSWWGLPLVVAGFFFYWVGYKANVYYFGYGAVQILLGAATIWILGWAYFHRLFFIWCFCAFTWPLYFLSETLALKLRLVMIKVSAAFLNLVGVSNQQVGTSIQSPTDFDKGIAQGELFALDIADPCSGIRSLFALMMVSALWGYIALKKPWQRIVVFLSAVPLAILGNFVRVNLLVFGSLAFGTEIAVGEEGGTSNFHFIAGIAVFVVALGGMVVLGKFLQFGTKIFRKEETVRTLRGNVTAEQNG